MPKEKKQIEPSISGCDRLILPTAKFPEGKRRPSQASMERLMDKISRKLLVDRAKRR